MHKDLINKLNANTKEERLNALKELMVLHKNGSLEAPVITESVNNHIHTTYSFSPYSPTKAVYMAYIAGLQTCGIMDHDSIGGAEEFIEAGKIADMVILSGNPYETDAGKLDTIRVEQLLLQGKPYQKIDQNPVGQVLKGMSRK